MAFNYYPQYMPQYQPPQQVQSSGFVCVRNEAEAKNYPIAPGNSVTFKDETAPYVYTKTMGFSQFDQPVFSKYRLVKEDAEETPAEKSDPGYDSLKAEIDALWNEINILKEPKKNSTKRREDGDT